MSVSNVSIANRALTLLSAERITSFNDPNEQARKISAIFEDTRDALISEHNWNFCTEQRNLSRLVDEPVLEDWTYIFQVPSDCIRILRMEGDYTFKIYGHKLYTNESVVKVDYLKRETDPTKFSPGFIKAFASRLAADLAFGITQNATFAAKIDDIAQRDLKEAKWTDAQEGFGQPTLSGTFILARQI